MTSLLGVALGPHARRWVFPALVVSSMLCWILGFITLGYFLGTVAVAIAALNVGYECGRSGR